MMRSCTPKTLSLAKSITPLPSKSAEIRDDLLQRLAEGRAEVVASQSIGDIGGEKPDPVAAIIGLAVEFEAEEAVLRHQLDHRVGQLNLAAGAGMLGGDPVEDLRLQNIATGNDEI